MLKEVQLEIEECGVIEKLDQDEEAVCQPTDVSDDAEWEEEWEEEWSALEKGEDVRAIEMCGITFERRPITRQPLTESEVLLRECSVKSTVLTRVAGAQYTIWPFKKLLSRRRSAEFERLERPTTMTTTMEQIDVSIERPPLGESEILLQESVDRPRDCGDFIESTRSEKSGSKDWNLLGLRGTEGIQRGT
jgi:hypothetical protein